MSLTGQHVFYRNEWWRVTGYYDQYTIRIVNKRTTLFADVGAVITKEIIKKHKSDLSYKTT